MGPRWARGSSMPPPKYRELSPTPPPLAPSRGLVATRSPRPSHPPTPAITRRRRRQPRSPSLRYLVFHNYPPLFLRHTAKKPIFRAIRFIFRAIRCVKDG